MGVAIFEVNPAYTSQMEKEGGIYETFWNLYTRSSQLCYCS